MFLAQKLKISSQNFKRVKFFIVFSGPGVQENVASRVHNPANNSQPKPQDFPNFL